MNLPVDLAAASREELIEVVGQLLSYGERPAPAYSQSLFEN